jgi:hypothetical protein
MQTASPCAMAKVVGVRPLALALSGVALAACATGEDLSLRHGSPLHTYTCNGGKTFLARQLMTGEVEVTAGGQTRDATDANGDPVPGGPRLTSVGEATQLAGMPGGPYEACVLDDEDAE